ncbi:dynein regulatory complex protein 1 isoform X2 [Cynoglossus semilaevis]|uniref:dynein regulatory complex protein 1 isoform X2 n=1 Tax=Cynoglossus semilaevis TaxID=244447 RepID=UPI0007DCA16C|nr:dynein regulatory complex protein 1 isoform X2 [Cynoglossus semilaevis]
MEEVIDVPGAPPEPAVVSQTLGNEQRASQNPIDNTVATESEPQKQNVQEQEKISAQRITNLHRHLTALVTNIQTAADARESMRRKDLEEAREMRLKLLENDMKSSQEKFAEITKGWSLAKDYVHAEELQIALDDQQRLLTILLQEKKSLINHLQEELKVGDDRFVKDLRKQTEERDLMLERMEDQIRTLTLAYREELLQTQAVNRQETDDLLTRDMSEWDQHIKTLGDTELDRLTERRKTVAEHEAKIHSLIFHTLDKQTAAKIEQNTKLQVMEREHQKILASNIIIRLKQIKERHELDILMNNRVESLPTEKKKSITTTHSTQPSKKSQHLSKEYKQSVQHYERLQKTIKQITLADTRTFEDMWLTVDAEVKQLVEKALDIDSLICKQHYGIAWQRPQLPVRGVHSDKHFHRSGHLQFSGLSQTNPASHRSRGMKTETDTESTDVEVCKDRSVVQSDGQAELEEEENMFSMEMLTKVMEPLWEEIGFLMEEDVKLLHCLDKDAQTAMKLGSLLSSLGIKEEDLPELVHFLLKYRQHQEEQTEDVCSETGESHDQAASQGTSSTSDLIQPHKVLPALKSFLQQYNKSSQQQSSARHTEAWSSSEDKAYWESLGNIISEDKVKLWEETEKRLKQYNSVLTEISELITETDSLKQQNAELRMLLQQSLNPQVA